MLTFSTLCLRADCLVSFCFYSCVLKLALKTTKSTRERRDASANAQSILRWRRPVSEAGQTRRTNIYDDGESQHLVFWINSPSFSSNLQTNIQEKFISFSTSASFVKSTLSLETSSDTSSATSYPVLRTYHTREISVIHCKHHHFCHSSSCAINKSQQISMSSSTSTSTSIYEAALNYDVIPLIVPRISLSGLPHQDLANHIPQFSKLKLLYFLVSIQRERERA